MSKFELEKKWQALIKDETGHTVLLSLRGESELAIKCNVFQCFLLHTFFDGYGKKVDHLEGGIIVTL